MQLECDTIFYSENIDCFNYRFKIKYNNRDSVLYLKNEIVKFYNSIPKDKHQGFKLMTNDGREFMLFSKMTNKIKIDNGQGSFDLILSCEPKKEQINKSKIVYIDSVSKYFIDINKSKIVKDEFIVR